VVREQLFDHLRSLSDAASRAYRDSKFVGCQGDVGDRNRRPAIVAALAIEMFTEISDPVYV
jgi:hypothetical protein